MKYITILLVCIAGVSAQDTLVSNTGLTYLGKVMGFSKNSVKFLVNDEVGAQQVQLERISKITKNGGDVLYDSNIGLTPALSKQEAEISYEQT